MFERFTESARRVLFFARYEASQLGATSIETEHLLLGLTREAKGITCEVFALSHVSLKGIRHDIESAAVFRPKVSTSVEMPFSAESRLVLQFCAEEADRMLHGHIGTEHLLLGLLREGTGVAGSTLAKHGLRLDAVRTEILSLLDTSSAPSGAAARTARLTEHVDRIERLAAQLGATTAEGSEPRQLVERILRELEVLKRLAAE